MQFRNVTVADEELSMLAAKRMILKFQIGLSAFVILILGGLALSMLFGALEENDPFTWGLFVFLIVMMLGTLLFIAFGFRRAVRRNVKKNLKGATERCEYVFSEDGYEINASLSDGSVSTTVCVQYESCGVVEETPLFWLIHYDKNHKIDRHAVLKSGMTEGTEAELAALLKEKFGKRYKIKRG